MSRTVVAKTSKSLIGVRGSVDWSHRAPQMPGAEPNSWNTGSCQLSRRANRRLEGCLNDGLMMALIRVRESGIVVRT